MADYLRFTVGRPQFDGLRTGEPLADILMKKFRVSDPLDLTQHRCDLTTITSELRREHRRPGVAQGGRAVGA